MLDLQNESKLMLSSCGMLLLLPIAAQCIRSAPQRCLQCVEHGISHGIWPTLIIFHSIFDKTGESYRPFVLTLILVMCQNFALTHPNFYLILGLLSSEKTRP